jgi:chromosome segregation ATPase
MTDIHSCSYYCLREPCVRAQRDYLRDENERLRAQVATLERDGPQMERAREDGNIIMGTMRECLQDAQHALKCADGIGDILAADNQELRAQVAELQENGNRLLAVADSAALECRELRAQVAALQADAEKLRSVMVAAAEEIDAHWDAHCDAEGYGPASLMHRLECGIPSQYGYTAGAFAKLKAERDAAIDAARKE